MEKIDSRIIRFIKRHHVLTLATERDNSPYCANCFYAFVEDENMLVFTSDLKTKHIKDAQLNEKVAGSIVLETKIIGKIQGIQFCGILSEPDNILLKKVNRVYLKRFPFAILADTQLWVVKLTFIKFTDNRLGFGKKLVWGQVANSEKWGMGEQ